MVHTKPDFFNSLLSDIRERYFANENHGFTRNEKYHAATYTVELFNNGCLTYRKLIGRLAKCCNENTSNIHEIVKNYIVSFGRYEYKPNKLTTK